MTNVEFVKELCKRKGIPVHRLEKDLGFANGYLNPKKLKKIPYERAILISNYLGIPLEQIYGKREMNLESSSYFLNEEAAKIAQELHDNHDLRIIFDATRKASKEDLEFIKDMINRMGLND